jgi:hypothetical protein
MEIPRKWRVVEVAKSNIELNAGFSNKPRSTTGGSTSYSYDEKLHVPNSQATD